MSFVEDRTRLDWWVDQRTDHDVHAYWSERNRVSIDGLPALDVD